MSAKPPKTTGRKAARGLRQSVSKRNVGLAAKRPCSPFAEACRASEYPVTSAPSGKNWQLERYYILSRLVRWIDIESEKGTPVQRLARRYSRRWDGPRYHSDPTRTIRLSPVSLKRIYYKWRRQPATALRFQYATSAARKIPRALLVEVLRRAPKHTSLKSVLRSIDGDFQRVKKIPGIGTWRAWAQKNGLKLMGRRSAIPLPHAHSIYRHMRGIDFKQRKILLQSREKIAANLRHLDQAIRQRSKALK